MSQNRSFYHTLQSWVKELLKVFKINIPIFMKNAIQNAYSNAFKNYLFLNVLYKSNIFFQL